MQQCHNPPFLKCFLSVPADCLLPVWPSALCSSLRYVAYCWQLALSASGCLPILCAPVVPYGYSCVSSIMSVLLGALFAHVLIMLICTSSSSENYLLQGTVRRCPCFLHFFVCLAGLLLVVCASLYLYLHRLVLRSLLSASVCVAGI